mgnify:CR=1 FL=1
MKAVHLIRRLNVILAGAGIETVVCGPGDVAQAHTKDEYVEVELPATRAGLLTRAGILRLVDTRLKLGV